MIKQKKEKESKIIVRFFEKPDCINMDAVFSLH